MSNIIYEHKGSKIIHADNLEVLDDIDIFPYNSIDSCISDFPYAISFMGKEWDAKSKHDFYDWCVLRAQALFEIMKPGSYTAIFGSPKTNHRMKCAFEDSGFIIVEEIDYIYCTGMPHNQDIGKMFSDNEDLSEKYDDWKTAGLKPSHETITIFQKPLEGTYVENIEKYGVGAFNIGACRVPISKDDIDTINAKASKNPTTNYSDKSDKVYGAYAQDIAVGANEGGRFPSNIVFDEFAAKMFDDEAGESYSSGGSGEASTKNRARNIYGAYNNETNAHYQNDSLGGYKDQGGRSRMFNVFKYCPKVSPQERMLPNGERNPHVTLKPKELIKWLIKLITPINGITIDITAGSCTHAVACEELNKEDNYNLTYVDIELCNDDENPYCDVGKQRVEAVVNSISKRKLF